MANFDPDAYLAEPVIEETDSSQGFDPDTYLAEDSVDRDLASNKDEMGELEAFARKIGSSDLAATIQSPIAATAGMFTESSLPDESKLDKFSRLMQTYKDASSELDDEAEKRTKHTVADALQGAGEGVSLGWGEEITAPFAAAVHDPMNTLKTLSATGKHVLPFIEPSEEDYAAVNKHSDLMQQYRDVARERQQEAIERNPVAFTAGAVGGGMLLPVPGTSIKGGVQAVKGGKALDIAAKAKAGAKLAGTGAGIGGVTGAGMSEGGISDRMDDAMTGAKYGAVFNTALPLLAKMGKGGVDLLKKGSKSLSETGVGKIHKAYKLDSQAFEIENAKKFFTELRNVKGEAVAIVNKVTGIVKDKLDDQLRVLDSAGAKKEMKTLLTNERKSFEKLLKESEDNEVRKAASDVIDHIDNYLEGIMTTKYAPKITSAERQLKQETARQKAYASLEEEKLAQMAQDPESIAFKKLQQKADLEEVTQDAMQTDFPQVETGTQGTRIVTQKLSKEIGDEFDNKTIGEIIEEGKFTPIQSKVDEDTGREILSFIGPDNKTYTKVVPKDIHLEDKLKITRGRFGSRFGDDVEMLPGDINQMGKTFKKFTKLEDENLPGEIRSQATEFGKQIKAQLPEEIQPTKERLSDLLSMKEMLTKQESGKFLTSADKLKMRNEFEAAMLKLDPDNMQQGEMLDILKGFVDPNDPTKLIKGLEDLAPEAAKKFTDEAPKIAEKIKLAYSLNPKAIKTIVADPTAQALAQMGGPAGILAKTARFTGRRAGEISNLSKRFIESDPARLATMAQQLMSLGPDAAKLARILTKAAEKDDRARRALLFGVMQNPAYREKLNKLEEGDQDVGQ